MRSPNSVDCSAPPARYLRPSSRRSLPPRVGHGVVVASGVHAEVAAHRARVPEWGRRNQACRLRIAGEVLLEVLIARRGREGDARPNDTIGRTVVDVARQEAEPDQRLDFKLPAPEL